MRTIRRDCERELHVRRSRFVCALARADDEGTARAFVAERRRRHWGAAHHCTAYVLGPDGGVQRSSDDGEPSGTAGVPMLEVLRHRALTNTVAVVTRYFGGVKLGAGGLVRAYGQAVSDAIDACGVVERSERLVVEVGVDYLRAGRVESALRESGHQVREAHYGNDVRIDVVLAEVELAAFRSWLAETTAGQAHCEVRGGTTVEVDVPDDP